MKLNETRKIFLLLFIFSCASCNFPRPLIDGKKKCVFSGECGTIEMIGYSGPLYPVLINCKFNGVYHVNVDSLRIEAASNDVSITNLRIKFDNNNIDGKDIEMKLGKTLSIWFDLKSATLPRPRWLATELLVLPSSFIICEGKPVIADTIPILVRYW